MKWAKDIPGTAIPVKSWAAEIEEGAFEQASNLAAHPAVCGHVALMPDCHVGYGMPIGGVVACDNAVIPNAVGVDIGCGMIAVETTCTAGKLNNTPVIRSILESVRQRVPLGEGNAHSGNQQWEGFERYLENNAHGLWPREIDYRNLGTLGGGNHFIELQVSTDDKIWLMIHSGSRNMGYRIAAHYHALAGEMNRKHHIALPHPELAFLSLDTQEGRDYIRDMNFALEYALENRFRIMRAFKDAVAEKIPETCFVREINIHHNYAAEEEHCGRKLWIHRKGATSAKNGETGIIPGSMGTSSYIVRGLGNPESFMSCSHGAGRKMGRNEACRRLSPEECDAAMDGIVFDRWHRVKGRRGKTGELDLSEAPLAYKDIDEVIHSELDLIEPLVKLRPLGVLKG